jgi:ribosomal protein L37AE/L43A
MPDEVGPMKVKTRCDHCGKLYSIAPAHLGKIAQCKNCHNFFGMFLYEEEETPASRPQPPQPVSELDDEFADPDPAAPAAQPQPAAPDEPDDGFNDPLPADSLKALLAQQVVCPKCGHTTGIHPATGIMRLRCPKCGTDFKVKPRPKTKPGGKPAERKRSRALRPLLILLFLALAAYLYLPKLFPDLFPNLLP